MSVPVTSVYGRMPGTGLTHANVKHYLRFAKEARGCARWYARRRFDWTVEIR